MHSKNFLENIEPILEVIAWDKLDGIPCEALNLLGSALCGHPIAAPPKTAPDRIIRAI